MNYLVNLIAGWSGFLAGIVSGAIIGLRFHNESWLGGYPSFSRRMVRLGHIAFFGLGLINILFAQSVQIPSTWTNWSAGFLIIALATMPAICFLTAWQKGFRHLFFIPTLSAALGVVALLVHLL